jgi:putative hydrolase of the HAD superfamily
MNKAVFFDLDNTLVHRNKSIAVYSERLLADFPKILIGVDSDKISKVIYAQDNGGYLAENSPYKTIKVAVSSELQKQFFSGSIIKVEDVRNHWMTFFPESTVAMDGADDLLRFLSGQGYHIGIISNGANKSRKSSVEKLASASFINQIVSSESAGVNKPNIEIFRESALAAGFTPDQCWFIGDHPKNDIDSARKAGMQAIWLRGFHLWPQRLQRPKYSIDDLAEVKSILQWHSSNKE